MGEAEKVNQVNAAEDVEEATAPDSLTSILAQTDDVTVCGDLKVHVEGVKIPRTSYSKPRLSGVSGSVESRSSVIATAAAEITTFYDVFGFLGVPMIIVFLVLAGWTFMLAVIQAKADAMANTIMNTTHFDKGEFWLLPVPDPEPGIIISSVILLSLLELDTLRWQ